MSENINVYEYVESICKSASKASKAISRASTADKNRAIEYISEELNDNAQKIINENKKDIEAATRAGIASAMLDRLMLNKDRINGIREALSELVKLTDPIGEGTRWTRPSGIIINKIKVPIGTVGIIYEARPNVTVDAAALCIKTGNAVVLRGGSDALNTNKMLVSLMKRALERAGIDPDAVSLIANTSRDSSAALMKMRTYIDLLIPRGGKGLIRSVVENAEVPVIETGAGNCHIYIDSFADIDKAVAVTVNAKCSRPSVCNAVETLVVHRDVLQEFLLRLVKAAEKYNIEYRADREAAKYIDGAIEVTEDDWSTEYDDYILAVKTVGSLEEAIEHINRYNTGHSEAIITESLKNAERFQNEIDAAAVYVNASTRFTDGGEFGLGAEIGISTQKLHARGPMGLDALTTVKYLINGNGTVR